MPNVWVVLGLIGASLVGFVVARQMYMAEALSRVEDEGARWRALLVSDERLSRFVRHVAAYKVRLESDLTAAGASGGTWGGEGVFAGVAQVWQSHFAEIASGAAYQHCLNDGMRDDTPEASVAVVIRRKELEKLQARLEAQVEAKSGSEASAQIRASFKAWSTAIMIQGLSQASAERP